MAVLNFTLSPEAVGKFNNALVCLGRFSDSVSIESNKDQLVLSTLNSTKSAYASFNFVGSKFFARYSYNPPRTPGQQPKEKFTCRIYNKALLSVFKGRAVDPAREKDTAIERCEVSIEDGAGEAKSRFIVRMTCRNGVLKTCRLTFEPEKSMHALFNPELAKNHWAISSKVLREFVEHFRAGTEQLDIYSEDGRASFTSYTEKIMTGNEILKQPLHTTIVIDTLEFSEFSVEEKLHIVISVKDFKAIVAHAGSLNATISANYSHPSKPIQLKYGVEGLVCEFILMTIGDFRGNPTSTDRDSPSKPDPAQHLEASMSKNRASTSLSVPPSRLVASSTVQEPTKSKVSRPSPPPPQPSLKSDTLFFPEYDDDLRWEPLEEDNDETLGWDMGTDHEVSTITLSRVLPRSQIQRRVNDSNTTHVDDSARRLEPTQRMSQIRGFFDD